MQNLYRQIFLNTTKYVVLRNIFMFITGIISIFIIRFLGPQEYGKYSLVWNLISTLGPILSLGWLSTLAKFVAKKNNIKEKSQIFSQSFFSVFIAGVAFIIIFNILVNLFPWIFPLEIKEISLIFSIFIFFVAFFNVFEGFFRGLGRFNEFVVIDGLRSNIGNLLGLLFVIYGIVSYKIIIKSNFIISFLFLVLLLFLTKNYLFFDFSKISKIEKQTIIFCLTFLIGQIIYMLSVNLDIILLRGILKDPQQVGYYTAGIRIPRLIESMFISQISAPILYYFSSSETFQIKEKILLFSSKILGFIFGSIGLLCFSLGRYIVSILFGGKFIFSIKVFEYFSLSLLISGFISLIPQFYISEDKPYMPTVIYFFCVVILCNFLNILLISKYNFFAPVLSYLFSFTLYGTILVLDIFRKFKINLIKNLFYLYLAILLAIIFEKITNILSSSFLLFVFICFLLKVVSFDDFLKFRNVFCDSLQKNF